MIQSRQISVAGFGRALLLLSAVLLAACGSPEQRAQSHYERGTQLLAQKDNARASVEFRNALKLDDKLVGAWLGLAQIEEQNRNWQALVKILRTAAQLEPKNIDTKLKLARLLLLGNALDEALNVVNAAGEVDARNIGVLTTRAAILLKLNDATGAIREAQAALEIDPANAEALMVLAAEKLTRGDAQGALAILERQSGTRGGAQAADNFGVQLFKLGIFERLGNLEQVEALLRKFVELHPQGAGVPPPAGPPLRQPEALRGGREGAARARRRQSRRCRSRARRRPLLEHDQRPGRRAAGARQARINAGGEVFRYQIALAEFHVRATATLDDSFALLQKLGGSRGHRASRPWRPRSSSPRCSSA